MDWVIAGIYVATIAYGLYLQSKLASQPPGQTIQGPTASEGVAITKVFGTKQITNPNVCWYGNQQDENANGTHYYSMDAQVVLCHGPVDKLIDIVTNNKRTMSCVSALPGHQTDPVTVDGTKIQAGQIGGHPDSTKFSMEAVVHMGELNTATTDPGVHDDLAAAMGLEAGPRYDGVAWLMCKFRLGTTPMLTPVEAIVQCIHTRRGGAAQWYDEKSEIATGRAIGDLWKYQLQAASDDSDWSDPDADDSAWPQAAGPISNAIAASQLMQYNDYPLPLVKTQLPVDGTIILDGGTFYYGNKYSGGRVQEGCKLWLRWNLGAIPAINIFAQLWFDDSAKLFFNGTEIEIKPTVVDSIPRNSRFNATAAIPASLINTAGPNVVAMRVLDSYESVFGTFTKGSKIGTAQLLYAGLQLGNDTSVPGKLVDMNPAHIIHNVLTDPLWGMGYNDADLDDTSFRAAADTLYAEQFGLSLAWSQQTTIEDFITEILRHISGVLYVSRSTGLFTLKLIRADYDAEDLLLLDEARIVKIEGSTRKLVGELVNTVTVTYSATPRGDQGSLTVFEEGLLQMQGGAVSSKIDYPGVTNSFIAGNLALRDLRALSSPLLSCTVYCSRHAAQLNVGDAFVLHWPDLAIDHFVMRVSAIDVGDGINNTVKITCLEDAFFYPNQTVTATNAPIASPVGPIVSKTSAREIYHTCKVTDDRRKDNCVCAFNGSAWAIGQGGTVVTNFVEIAPGVIERTFTGPLTADMFDDIDIGIGSPTDGVSWMVGQRFFLKSHHAEPDEAKAFQGPWILDDAGGYWGTNPDTGGPQFYPTKARFHRDPAFSTTAQFTAEATFYILVGTRYVGHYLQLAETFVLGAASNWNDIGTSVTWADSLQLLKTSELTGRSIPLDTLDTSATVANGESDFPISFPTLSGTPGTRVIPAAPWLFNIEAVWLDPAMAGDPGSVTVLGIKMLRNLGTSSPKMFEILSRQITATVPTPLEQIQYDAAQFLLNPTDGLVLIPTIHTDSLSQVKLWMRYNSPTLGTTVAIPVSLTGDPTVVIQPPAPIVLQAASMSLDGPSKFTVLGSAGNHTTAIGLPHGSDLGASLLVQIPQPSATGAMLVRPVWAPAIGAASGAVRWQVTITVVGAGSLSAAGTPAVWTGQGASEGSPFVTDTPITELGTSVAAVPQGSWVRIGLRRLGADAADTYTGQANLLGLQIDY